LIDGILVCRADEIRDGEARGFDVGRSRVVVIRRKDQFYALHDVCPHRAARLCDGVVGGTAIPSEVGVVRYGRDGEILRCPWHGWEFDITNGRSLHDPDRQRVRSYPVHVDAGQVFVGMSSRIATQRQG
jgi:nitrite reductase (NADH) small subunit